MSNAQTVTQHRIQAYFPDDLYQIIKNQARRKDKSIAEIIRDAVRKAFSQKLTSEKKSRQQVWEKFMKASGIGRSGLGDLAKNHDKYFDAFGGKRKGKSK